ncbi:esterase-like activity of phytase family protein [Oryzifoliimicrobium ureilyticus]|uniref:esterase-like activity of phytase family protein n=1 Tax=Oryzifoliimicrobium ureilyticus TaxID=3113724 RepID=UPI003076181D
MSRFLLGSISLLAILSTQAFADQQEFPAMLAGQVVIPANTMVPAPADAAEFLRHSGKFTTPDRKRTEALGTVPGMDGKRPTGLSLPFDGQPLQGFSGIKHMSDGTFWTLTDNGFGSKANSSDAMLFLHHMRFEWDKGTYEVIENVFLSDPDKKAPFPIVMEGANKRYLTGADFDIESIQPVEDGFWIGEEFGPYLLKFSKQGQLTDVISTVVDGKPVMSPDNPVLSLPSKPTDSLPAFNLRRSNGFEGLAMAKDGSKLYGLLEGPIFQNGKAEEADGHTALRIVEFDVASKAWTGRSWLYPFEDKGVSIGDFNLLDRGTALVIERDGGEGTTDKACPDPKAPGPDCFEAPAQLKRVYKIAFDDSNVGKAVRKIGFIDLLHIQDPDKKKRVDNGKDFYDMPFVTIENVDRVDETHIIIGNDNNLPFSAGRQTNKADDNEFSLIEASALLQAK